MKTRALVVSAAAVGLLLSACGSEESNAGTTSQPMPTLDEESLTAVWPENGSKVFQSFDMVVGLGQMMVPGRIAVTRGKAPVAAGELVAAGPDVQLFAPGQNHGAVTLPVGKQSVVVQVLDASGQSMGPARSHVVSYDVVAEPGSPGVHFVEPRDGATVKTTFRVQFGVRGMGMSPAEQNAHDKTVGHHHILLNEEPIFPSKMIPKDQTHLHYGKAQQEAELTLDPGGYTLTMQFADGNHRSYGPRMSAQIKVVVEK